MDESEVERAMNYAEQVTFSDGREPPAACLLCRKLEAEVARLKAVIAGLADIDVETSVANMDRLNRTLAWLRKTARPALIVEAGYLDTDQCDRWYDSQVHTRAEAEAIGVGIRNFLPPQTRHSER